VANTLLDKVPCGPCRSEVIHRAVRVQRRAFDSRNPCARNQQVLVRAIAVFEYRTAMRFAIPEIDRDAWRRIAMLLLIRHAALVNNLPKRIGIAMPAAGKRSGTHSDRD